jgi:hypothetical protein
MMLRTASSARRSAFLGVAAAPRPLGHGHSVRRRVSGPCGRPRPNITHQWSMMGSGFNRSPFLPAPVRARRGRIRASRQRPLLPFRDHKQALDRCRLGLDLDDDLNIAVGRRRLRGLGRGASSRASDAIWCNATRICSSSSCSGSWWSGIRRLGSAISIATLIASRP